MRSWTHYSARLLTLEKRGRWEAKERGKNDSRILQPLTLPSPQTGGAKRRSNSYPVPKPPRQERDLGTRVPLPVEKSEASVQQIAELPALLPLIKDRQNVVLTHDQDIFVVDHHLGTRPTTEDHAIPLAHLMRYALAVG